MFYGEYFHSIDRKGRLILPAKFREVAKSHYIEKFFVTRGLDVCLFMFPEEEWRTQENKFKSIPFTKQQARTFNRLYFSGAAEVDFDTQGRILLPQYLKDFAQIKKEVVIALDSEPVKYTPIPPEEVLSRLRINFIHSLEVLRNDLLEIYKHHQSTDNYIWNVSGRPAIMNKVNDFIHQSGKKIHLSVWDEEIEEIRDSLKRAQRRKVAISVVHYGEKKLGFGSEYRHGREHTIRQQRGARRIALEVDEQKVILAHFLEDGSSNAVWTTNKGLVLLAKDYIIHDIYTIRMAEKFGEAANEIFESH